MSEKTFTLDEAQSMLPALAGLVRTAIDGKKIIDDVDTNSRRWRTESFSPEACSSMSPTTPAGAPNAKKALQRVKDAVHEIDAIGVQIKDLDIGLLDFPCLVNGETVLLC